MEVYHKVEKVTWNRS